MMVSRGPRSAYHRPPSLVLICRLHSHTQIFRRLNGPMWIPKERPSQENNVRLMRLEDLLRILRCVYETDSTDDNIGMSFLDGLCELHLQQTRYQKCLVRSEYPGCDDRPDTPERRGSFVSTKDLRSRHQSSLLLASSARQTK